MIFFKCRTNLLDEFGKKYRVSGRIWDEFAGRFRDEYFETIPKNETLLIKQNPIGTFKMKLYIYLATRPVLLFLQKIYVILF